MRIFRTCFIAGWLYPDALFRIRTTEKLLCLTFDDGPDPLSTLSLLDLLDRHSIKAVFFCKGVAAKKYPELINQIKTRGHLVGNHGYSHPDGWKTSLKRFTDDVLYAAPYTSYTLFRPPYGHLRLDQYRKLHETYKIVFWDIMPYDFDKRFGGIKSLQTLKKKIRPGSIIVLHDDHKSMSQEYIEEFIFFARREGFRFDNSILDDSSSV
jgi:peptidoglycan-N-acetylglucosamine deacetylase